MSRIPFLLIWFRLLLAPVAIIIAVMLKEAAGPWLTLILVSGVLSDVFDGIVARKLGISTDALRKADSNADLAFLLSILLSTGIAFPKSIQEKGIYIGMLIALELIIYAVTYMRFGKSPANHAYLSKFFAVMIVISLCTLYVGGSWGPVFYMMFFTGVTSYIDNLLIILLLREYRVDTKSTFSALKLRRR